MKDGAPDLMMMSLAYRAEFMKEAPEKSQSITDSMVSILGSFNHRLSALEIAMRPTQIRTYSVRRVHENIDNTMRKCCQFANHGDAESEICDWRRWQYITTTGWEQSKDGDLTPITITRTAAGSRFLLFSLLALD